MEAFHPDEGSALRYGSCSEREREKIIIFFFEELNIGWEMYWFGFAVV